MCSKHIAEAEPLTAGFQMELVASEYERRITNLKPSESTTAFYSSTRSCRPDGLELQYQYWLESFVSPTKIFGRALFAAK